MTVGQNEPLGWWEDLRRLLHSVLLVCTAFCHGALELVTDGGL